MASDLLDVEILEDGTIKVSTGRVSAANHMNAEAFLREIGRLCGGKVERKQTEGFLGHSHSHGHGFHVHN
jgi:hypothetical protein